MPTTIKELQEKLGANNPWINGRTAFIVRHGSRAYGTNTPTSDEDFKGVAIAPRECYLGFIHKFGQQELKDPDTVVYEIKKFFDLASACNPNIIEVLHTDPSDHVLVNATGARILEAKDRFLSKRVRYTFAGYAKSQLGRIETHRRWLLDPPTKKPERSDFGLLDKPEIPVEQLMAAKAEIAKELERYNLEFLDDLREDQKIAVQNTMHNLLAEISITKDDKWMSACRKIGFSDNFIAYMQKERAYEGKKREWDQFSCWEIDRNPARAALEAKHGYDTKHAYHLIRLMRMCKEILEIGKVIVRRPDWEELLAIRNGAWSYDELIGYARNLESRLDEICARSKLPGKPDADYLNNLCIEIIEMML